MKTSDAQLIRDHLDWMQLRGLAGSVIRRRRVVLGWVAATLPGGLLDATRADLAGWRAGLDVAPEAVAVYVSHVRQFYAWAVAQELLAGSPAASLPAPRRGRRLPRPIAEAELLEAVSAAGDRVRPWLVLAGWAGLRAVEIARLRRENVLDTRQPPVLLVARGATKGHAERLVPMSPFLLAELAPCLDGRGWVFPRRDKAHGPNTAATISHLANRHLHDCGIQATLHQLRHRFGTQAYHATRDLRLVQELMGHATPVSTAGYAAYDAAAAVAAVGAIPAPGRLHSVRAG